MGLLSYPLSTFARVEGELRVQGMTRSLLDNGIVDQNYNGATLPVRLGCQETAGVAPGAVDAPAAECTPACTCVPANLVAGPTPDDEVCILAGFFYEAAGGSCDISSLPVVN